MTGNAKTTDAHGVIIILATVFAMALADAVVKHSSADLPLWQIWVWRSALVVPVLLVMARRALWPVDLGWVLLRCGLLAAMYLGIYAAIPLLDLSVIAAALYTGPLFIVALSVLMLGQTISVRQGLAIICGFAGVLLIVRPLASGFSPLALLPVGAALLYALAAVLTRARLGQTPAVTMALWLNLTFLVGGGAASLAIWAGLFPAIDYPFLFGPWQPMGIDEWLIIAVLSVLMIGIGIGLARAYQSPRPQVIATFDYAYLIFAAFWGYVFFGEVPDIWTLAGMLVIVGAGMMVLYSANPAVAP